MSLLSNQDLYYASCRHVEDYKNRIGLRNFDVLCGCVVTPNTGKALHTKARCCWCKACGEVRSRLHACLYCVYFGCYESEHIHQHAFLQEHYLAVDVTHGMVYCFLCEDYVHDFEFEQLARGHKRRYYRLIGLKEPWAPLDATEVQREVLRNQSVQNLSPYSYIGLRGLISLGQTCFMNCILQVLLHAPLLKDYFLSGRSVCKHHELRDSTCLSCEMCKLFQEFYSGETIPFKPTHFMYLIWKNARYLAIDQQQDAHEFFLALTNILHQQYEDKTRVVSKSSCIVDENTCSCVVEGSNCSCIVDEDTCLCITDHDKCICISDGNNSSKIVDQNKCSCIVDQIFTGKLETRIKCEECGNELSQTNGIVDISLVLHSNNINRQTVSTSNEKSSKRKEETTVDREEMPFMSLIHCLESYIKPESVTHTCSNCHSNDKSMMQVSFKKLPNILCFHFKNRHEARRNNTSISFPLHVDMTRFLSSYVQNRNLSNIANDDGSDISNRYTLFGIVNHKSSWEGGHYYCYIRRSGGNQWFKCDDQFVTAIRMEDIISSEVYLLFYHKSDSWNMSNISII